MNAREKFIDYVKNGGNETFVSFQIGAGAGFDCKLAGKEWNSEGTLDDTIKAYQIVGGEPMFNVGLPDVGSVIPNLVWQTKIKETENTKIISSSLNTPYGPINWKFREQKKHGLTPMEYPLTMDSENIFDIVSWYMEQHLELVKNFDELIGPVLQKAQPYGAVSVQWNIQPFELMGLLSVENLAMLAMLEPERYRQTCDLIRDINIELI